MQSVAQNIIDMNSTEQQVSETEDKFKTFVSKVQKLKDIRKRMKEILLEGSDEKIKTNNKG